MTPVRLIAIAAFLTASLTGCPDPKPAAVCDLSNEQWTTIEGNGSHSTARVWNELIVYAIRKDLPQPTVHARNLFHLSAAMYDAWASQDATAQGVFFKDKIATANDAARAETIAFAAHRILKSRYASSANPITLECFDVGLKRAGFDPNNTSTQGDTPAAFGNRIGQTVLDATRDDGSNEANGYKDTTGFKSVNPVLQPEQPGTGMVNPDQWQPLLLQMAFSQNGIPQDGQQKFVGASWREVRPFAMKRTGKRYHDPGPAPTALSSEMKNKWLPELLRKQSQLDSISSVTMNASPGALGNNSLGNNDGVGHVLNPVTGAAYAPQVVKRSDYWRIVAEFWADGPSSETPPGHWNVDGLITNDKFCFTRKTSIQLQPNRRINQYTKRKILAGGTHAAPAETRNAIPDSPKPATATTLPFRPSHSASAHLAKSVRTSKRKGGKS